MDVAHQVVALPYPGRSHINAMRNMCEHLVSRAGGRLLVTFVVTEEWLGLLFPASAPLLPGIRFRTIPNVIPSELNRGADLVGFIDAVCTRMEAPFEELLERLQEEEEEEQADLDLAVKGIISDDGVPWAVAVGNRRDLPVYSLFTMSASFFSVFYHFHLIPSNGHTLPEKPNESLDCIPGVTSLKMADIQSVCSHEKVLELFVEAASSVNKAQGLLFTSFHELEPRTLDALNAKLPVPVYTVGPSIPHLKLQEKAALHVRHVCVAIGSHYSWLDSQPRSSVLYVSFGSFLSVSDEQMDEIARGLRASHVRFLWVARRDASRMRELGGGKGLVVPWCDQLKVLCHPAVGGFLTHCGWNSILEAVFAGVPMLTFPISLDQPSESRLIVDEWRTGLSLKGETVDGGVVGREQIAREVTRLMDLEGDESKELRRRAGELKDACRRAVQPDGSSTIALDAFIAQVMSENKA